MKRLTKGSLASTCEIAQKVDEIVEWINEHKKEDHEEPKVRVFKSIGTIGSSVHIETVSKEEADRAAEKLKAWQRLKAKGFVWQGWEETAMDNGMCIVGFQIPENNWETDVVKDLDLLFSEEEE